MSINFNTGWSIWFQVKLVSYTITISATSGTLVRTSTVQLNLE